MNYLQIRDVLKEKGLLSFSGYHHKKMSFSDFFKSFFTLNLEYPTIDAEGTTICGKGKLRSYGDIYRICKFYYPTLKISTVYTHLCNGIIDGTLRTFICATIHKRVWKQKSSMGSYFNSFPIDEFGTDFSKLIPNIESYKDSGAFGTTYGENELNF